MALEDKVKKQEAMEEKEAPSKELLTDEEEEDLKIAVMLSENLIDDGGWEVISQALEQSSDPGQVIGDFLMKLVMQISEQMPNEITLSPRVFLAEGGWVEQISDYLQEQYGVPQDVMDRAEIYIGTQAMSMAQGAAQQQTQSAPQPAAPAAGGLESAVGGMV